MPFSKLIVLKAFDPATTAHNVIRVSTILAILITIATCISVGILVGSGKISAFTQTETILIYQSNMSLVLNRDTTTEPLNWNYIYPSNNATLKDFTITLNRTMSNAFPSSFLHVAVSTLSVIWEYKNFQTTYRYGCKVKAFFKHNQISDEIKDALEFFNPSIITFSNGSYTISIPTSFNRILSNVTDAQLTNLTLVDLPSITVANGSNAFV